MAELSESNDNPILEITFAVSPVRNFVHSAEDEILVGIFWSTPTVSRDWIAMLPDSLSLDNP